MNKFKTSDHSRVSVKIWGLFNFFERERGTKTTAAATEATEATEATSDSLNLNANNFSERIIELDRYLYHQHAIRKSRRITALMGYAFGVILILMVATLWFLFCDYLGNKSDYRDWGNYLSGKHIVDETRIDITGIGEAQPVYIDTQISNNTYHHTVSMEISIPYSKARLISTASLAAILTECPDGILRYGWLDLEQVREYVSDQQYGYHHEPGVFHYTIKYQTDPGHNLHVWFFRTHQNLTRFLHLRSNLGIIWWFVAILFVLFAVLELIDFALQEERRHHLYYCQTSEDLQYVSPADRSAEDAAEVEQDSDDSADPETEE